MDRSTGSTNAPGLCTQVLNLSHTFDLDFQTFLNFLELLSSNYFTLMDVYKDSFQTMEVLCADDEAARDNALLEYLPDHDRRFVGVAYDYKDGKQNFANPYPESFVTGNGPGVSMIGGPTYDRGNPTPVEAPCHSGPSAAVTRPRPDATDA